MLWINVLTRTSYDSGVPETEDLQIGRFTTVLKVHLNVRVKSNRCRNNNKHAIVNKWFVKMAICQATQIIDISTNNSTLT